MLQEKILAVDFSEESGALQILPHPPLVSSYKLGWNGIYVQHHLQPAWETPEYCWTQHAIAFVHSEHKVRSRRVLDGRRQSEQLKRGDVAIIPVNVPHKNSWDREIDFTLLTLEPAHIAHIAHESIDAEKVEIVPHFAHPEPLLAQIGLAIKTELETDSLGSRVYVESLATALSAHLLRHYSVQKHTLREYTDGLPKYKLQQAIEYINEHLTEDLSLAAIADHVGMSHYYFARLFKQSTGLSPHRYVIQCRVELALQFLRDKERSISDIALECGFANQSHLAKHFRQFTGVTPKAYRES